MIMNLKSLEEKLQKLIIIKIRINSKEIIFIKIMKINNFFHQQSKSIIMKFHFF